MSENVTELLAEIERLRARVAELEARELFLLGRSSHSSDHEAAEAMRRGTLAPHPADDEPARFTHDVPPNAPR